MRSIREKPGGMLRAFSRKLQGSVTGESQITSQLTRPHCRDHNSQDSVAGITTYKVSLQRSQPTRFRCRDHNVQGFVAGITTYKAAVQGSQRTSLAYMGHIVQGYVTRFTTCSLTRRSSSSHRRSVSRGPPAFSSGACDPPR